MRANAAAYLGQGRGLVVDLGRFGEASLFYEPHGGGNVVVGRACQHAGSGVRAMDAARCLHHRPLGVEGDDNVVKVAGPFLGRTKIKIKEGAIRPLLAVYFQELAWDCLHDEVGGQAV